MMLDQVMEPGDEIVRRKWLHLILIKSTKIMLHCLQSLRDGTSWTSAARHGSRVRRAASISPTVPRIRGREPRLPIGGVGPAIKSIAIAMDSWRRPSNTGYRLAVPRRRCQRADRGRPTESSGGGTGTSSRETRRRNRRLFQHGAGQFWSWCSRTHHVRAA